MNDQDFYTVVLRKSGNYWVGLCLENGLVGQGITQEEAINKLKEAIESFEEVYQSQENIYNAPVPLKELHEFLSVENSIRCKASAVSSGKDRVI